MNERVLSRQETRRKSLELVTAMIAREYPDLPNKQVKRLARQMTREALKGHRGQRMVVRYEPSSLWQWLKDKFAPAWFIKFYPVQYVER